MDFPQMRDFSEFCVQLNDVRGRFHMWDSCERTVALYYLMVGLPFANAKFLQHALEQCISAVNTPEAQSLEREANDPTFIMTLLSERPHVALSVLLTHLPLLKPGKKHIADCYLMTIRKVLSEFITPPSKIYNECVEIMSYVFVHPAFDKEDKKSFKQLLKQVVNRVNPDTFIHSPVNESSDESVSPNPDSNISSCKIGKNLDVKRSNRRSNSLTPAHESSHESLSQGQEAWSSQENLTLLNTKQRSFSLSSDKTLPINLPNTLQSSSSETKLSDLQMMCNQPVMKSILSWLKSLRLHKYAWVFNNLTYEQILNLNDETLISIGITKGARHKLLLSIAKLKERGKLLTELEAEVMNGGDLLNALKKLKAILQSPLQVTNGEDLSSQFVKVMGKVCAHLLMLRHPSDESIVLFSTLCERAESCEAFIPEQKRRLMLWRDQLARGSHTMTYLQVQQNYNNYRQVPNASYPVPMMGPSLQHLFASKSSSYPNVQNNQTIIGHRHSIGSIALNNFLQSIPIQNIYKNDLSNNYYQTSHSYSTQHHQVRFNPDSDCVKVPEGTKKQILKSIDIESSLESLCLQMMEHALGP